VTISSAAVKTSMQPTAFVAHPPMRVRSILISLRSGIGKAFKDYPQEQRNMGNERLTGTATGG
jgi:hypothetical protein